MSVKCYEKLLSLFTNVKSCRFEIKKISILILAENPFFDLRNGLFKKAVTSVKEKSPSDIQDLDIFFYDTVPSEMYLKSASVKGKKEAPKWLSHSIRSPFQKAFEIAMLKFNVGLGK